MGDELFRVIKEIDPVKLDEADKSELIKIFMKTDDARIRNHIAFIFSDLNYNNAIPFIIKKINRIDTTNNNGSLVYALESMNVRKYFLSFVKMICEQGYEARLVAYGIIEHYSREVSDRVRQSALGILQTHRIIEEQSGHETGENSTLHFIKEAEKLLQQ